jgi:hypothetical protein
VFYVVCKFLGADTKTLKSNHHEKWHIITYIGMVTSLGGNVGENGIGYLLQHGSITVAFNNNKVFRLFNTYCNNNVYLVSNNNS